MEKLTVNLGEKSYPIYIGDNILPKLGEIIKEQVVGKKILLVTNPTVHSLYGATAEKSLREAGFDVVPGIIPDGEKYKSLETAQMLYDTAFDRQLDRKCAVVALGGGVVGDLAGFVAATYMRGVPFIQVPTTLLAQVDSSVGGKVAVNHPGGKNIIGAFYQPRLVFADINTLKTLPEREFKAGMAEVIKYGVIWDAEFFSYLENNLYEINKLDPDRIRHIVRTSCHIKAQVVARDEKENNLRAILNYGHTFGHAFEALTAYKKYLHGEAIAIGMVSAANTAVGIGLLKREEAAAIRRLIEKYGLPTSLEGLSIEQIIEKMSYDKKAEGGKIRFILPEKIGRVGIYPNIGQAVLREALLLQN